jgi:uncharacterized protein YutE (UPF0331/DUF86 family)
VVDRDLVLRKLSDLERYIVQVSEYRDISAERYREDWRSQRIVERTLQMAIEACVDIAAHVIADRGLPVPATYAEVFEILGQARLIEAGLRDAMVRMARFRNIIVHEYTRIDPEIVVQILRNNLDDLTSFRTAALGWR